jgi:hypothetical protein
MAALAPLGRPAKAAAANRPAVPAIKVRRVVLGEARVAAPAPAASPSAAPSADRLTTGTRRGSPDVAARRKFGRSAKTKASRAERVRSDNCGRAGPPRFILIPTTGNNDRGPGPAHRLCGLSPERDRFDTQTIFSFLEPARPQAASRKTGCHRPGGREVGWGRECVGIDALCGPSQRQRTPVARVGVEPTTFRFSVSGSERNFPR